LEVSLDPTALESIQCGYFMSKFGHAKEIRDDGSRYFDHPKGAAWIYINEFGGRNPRLIIVMLLHDIRENTYLLSSYRISWNFGSDIALDVYAVTKLPKGKEPVEIYVRRTIARGPYAITAKLFDVLHNMRTLDECSKEKKIRQIKETKKIYMPKLIPALRSFGGEWTDLANLLEKKIREALRLVKAK
jgi:(p)ppGpp synthase/HD superfamily hydrolase